MPGMRCRPAASALLLACFPLLLSSAEASAQEKPRARALGIPFEGTPGPLNAITDVAGVEVGLTTLISGTSVRTGVTAVLPRGRASNDSVFAGWFSLNGNGEMTGTTWIEEAGFLDGPVFITNTHSVGIVHAAAIEWAVTRGPTRQPWSLPVVAETWDGGLSDINGFHVKPAHVFAAIEGARGGPVPEGNTGGGTGHPFVGAEIPGNWSYEWTPGHKPVPGASEVTQELNVEIPADTPAGIYPFVATMDYRQGNEDRTLRSSLEVLVGDGAVGNHTAEAAAEAGVEAGKDSPGLGWLVGPVLLAFALRRR